MFLWLMSGLLVSHWDTNFGINSSGATLCNLAKVSTLNSCIECVRVLLPSQFHIQVIISIPFPVKSFSFAYITIGRGKGFHLLTERFE